MADLSNEELKSILEKRLSELEGGASEPKNIDSASVEFLLKTLTLPSDFAPLAQKVFELTPRTRVVWLHLAECTGCSESFLRTAYPNLADLLFDFISLDYHETLMLANGWQAEFNLEELLHSQNDFVLAVEGGVAAFDTHFLTIGAKATSGFELLQEVANRANAIFAMGTCSSYGGIQAASPNPTRCCGISEVLSQKVVQVPGCPPSDINIVATLAFYALFGVLPNLDSKNRPKWAYGKCLHDMCERKMNFESGIFAEKFDDELIKKGACLFKVGCKGPYTYNNCPKVKFNGKTSWPVQAGHGCMACCEPNFWDDFGFYELPMNNAYAYKDFSLQNLAVANMPEFRANGEKMFEVLEKNVDKNDNFLQFESNVKLILQNLSKNKIGAALVQNYKDKFPQNYAFIEANFDENPHPSSDIVKFFDYIFVLAKGEHLKDARHFFECAKSYKFKHPSPFEMKVSASENGAKLDISKAMRFPLIYLCGGLEIEGIAYSACVSLFDKVKEALNIAK